MYTVAQIVGWRLVGDDKIILSIADEAGRPDIEVELPLDIYKEIVVEGPPSEEKRVRENIDEIHKIIQKRLLNYDKLLEATAGNTTKINEGLDNLKKADSKLEVSKWKAYLDGVGKLKANNQELRHLIKALYQEESKLRASLLRKLKG